MLKFLKAAEPFRLFREVGLQLSEFFLELGLVVLGRCKAFIALRFLLFELSSAGFRLLKRCRQRRDLGLLRLKLFVCLFC